MLEVLSNLPGQDKSMLNRTHDARENTKILAAFGRGARKGLALPELCASAQSFKERAGDRYKEHGDLLDGYTVAKSGDVCRGLEVEHFAFEQGDGNG
eukprot:10832699-Lingulodinium_polyedra.AAC.1